MVVGSIGVTVVANGGKSEVTDSGDCGATVCGVTDSGNRGLTACAGTTKALINVRSMNAIVYRFPNTEPSCHSKFSTVEVSIRAGRC